MITVLDVMNFLTALVIGFSIGGLIWIAYVESHEQGLSDAAKIVLLREEIKHLTALQVAGRIVQRTPSGGIQNIAVRLNAATRELQALGGSL